jgi:DNA ligase (NAD+)
MNREEELENKIKYHKALYYQGRPEISDVDYDNLEDELRSINPESPILKMIGSYTDKTNKVEHKTKMLSLNKTYKEDELLSWMGENEVISMHKIDGVSCSLIYDAGKLVVAKTRGDGQLGENITAKVNWISHVLKDVAEKKELEIRGELFCTESNFLKLANEMEKIGLERPTSQRNIVAGLMGRKENLELSRYLSFYAFDLITSMDNIENEEAKFNKLKELGFETPEVTKHKDTKKIKNELVKTLKFISEGEYQIDGIVFSYNNLQLQDQLGATAHHPRYKMAFKFAGESKETEIESISWQVSRNGILTPIANVKPVELAGARIARVTLHNYGQVKTHNLKAGDKISIIRSGEVIPKFLSVVKESSAPFEVPEVCPSCGEKVYIEDIRLNCINNMCPVMVRETILNFIQKIGIVDLSEKRLEELISNGLVKNMPDLFLLKREDLLKLDKIKDILADKLLNSIDSVKEVDLITFLSSLGLKGGAYNRCEKLVLNGFNTIEKVLELSSEELVKIDGFAEKSSIDLVKSIQEKKTLIAKLLDVGMIIKKEEKVISPITMKKICITGSLTRKRSEIETYIRDMGGIVTSSVGKATDYLLTNDKEGTSSKFKKAIKLEVSIISEDDFFNLFN